MCAPPASSFRTALADGQRPERLLYRKIGIGWERGRSDVSALRALGHVQVWFGRFDADAVVRPAQQTRQGGVNEWRDDPKREHDGPPEQRMHAGEGPQQPGDLLAEDAAAERDLLDHEAGA